MIASFSGIRALLKQPERPVRLAVAAAHDAHTLDAVARATEEGLIAPVLIGDAARIRALRAAQDWADAVIDEPDADRAAALAAAMARRGEVHLVMKGTLETARIMKAMLDRESGVRAGGTMSLLALIESPYYHKVFGVTDIGLLTYPTLEQKADAVRNAVKLLNTLRVDRPKVAALAAVERPNPRMKESTEAQLLREMARAGIIEGCELEGPISYDLAMQPGAAARKGYISPVAGDADLLLVPDIACGNVLVKALTVTGGARIASLVLGALVPLVVTSRSATSEDKYMSLVLGILAGRNE